MKQEELECRILYAIIVAGKSARFAEQAFKQLFGTPTTSVFEIVRAWVKEGVLPERLRTARVGNYGKIERAFKELVAAKIDLATCCPEELEKIHGIGPKTSRFYIIWTRPEARVAVLDVHILRWLRKLGHDVPLITPSQPRYARIEKLFLKIADESGLTPRQVDEQIWMKGSNYGKYNPELRS
jgi:thermostable 8-oxoguanine DNA glycosylase